MRQLTSVLIQVNIVDCVRYLRCRSRECCREDHVRDGRIHVEGDVESIVDFISIDSNAGSLDESMVCESVQVWTCAALYPFSSLVCIHIHRWP